jgi:hypothetical protein
MVVWPRAFPVSGRDGSPNRPSVLSPAGAFGESTLPFRQFMGDARTIFFLSL